MGKKGKRKNQKISDSSITVVPFRCMWIETISSTAKQLSLSQGRVLNSTSNNCSSRLANIAEQFTLFRFTKLDITLYPFSQTGTIAVAYVPSGTAITPPTTVQDVVEGSDSIFLPSVCTVPVSTKFNRSILRGAFDWYRVDSTIDASEFLQGAITCFGTGTSLALNAMVRGVCEFKGPVDPAVALARMRQRVNEELFPDGSTNLSVVSDQLGSVTLSPSTQMSQLSSSSVPAVRAGGTVPFRRK